MKSDISELFSRSFVSDVMKLMAGTVGAQLITFALLPAVTRLYSATNFGKMTTFGTIVTTISVISCGCYEQAIVLPKQDKEGWTTTMVAFTCLTATVAVSFCIMALGHQFFGQLLFGPEGAGWLIWLIPLGVLFSGIPLVLRYWCIRRRRFGELSINGFIGAMGNQGTKVGFGLALGDRLFGLIAGVMGYSLFPGLAFVVQLLRKDWSVVKYIPSLREIWEIMVRYRSFPFFATSNEFLVNIGRSIPVFFLAAMYGNAAVGAFGLADNALRLPITVVSNSFHQVLLERFAKSAGTGKPLHGGMLRATVGLFLIGLVPFGAFTLLAPKLFGFFFGEKWIEAGRYAQVLVPQLFSMFILPPATIVYTVLGKQKERLGFYVGMVLAQVACFLLASHFVMSALNAVLLVSVASAGCNILNLLFGYRLTVITAIKNEAIGVSSGNRNNVFGR